MSAMTKNGSTMSKYPPYPSRKHREIVDDKPRIEDEFLLDLIRITYRECTWKRGYRPTSLRRWEVDIVSEPLKIAIEIEGQRHGSAKQRRSDSEKQNFLAARGWKCFRYPASSVLNKKRRARILFQLKLVVFDLTDEDSDSCVLIGE